jgi:hypothetical protein
MPLTSLLYLFLLSKTLYNHIIEVQTFCILEVPKVNLLCPSLNSFSYLRLCSGPKQIHSYYFSVNLISSFLFYKVCFKNWQICRSLTNHYTSLTQFFYSLDLLETGLRFCQLFICIFLLSPHQQFFAFSLQI